MAAENFIHDLSEYLTAGNLSDLTLVFGERKWEIHKALVCCHSKWFHKAVTGGFQESESNVITLNDDPEFETAIGCMVSYFYSAAYTTSPRDESASEALLHAQVATLADKYDCASLYKLAGSQFADSVSSVNKEDWIVVAGFVYSHTAAEVAAHNILRSVVVAAIAQQPAVLTSVLGMEDAQALLRSTPDLATDLLLQTPIQDKATGKGTVQRFFVCGKCRYAHFGPSDCSYVTSYGENTCPYIYCRRQSGTTTKKHIYTVGQLKSWPCYACGGSHTESVPDDDVVLEPEPVDSWGH